MEFFGEMMGLKLSGTGIPEQSLCQAHWFLKRRSSKQRALDRIIDARMLFVRVQGVFGDWATWKF